MFDKKTIQERSKYLQKIRDFFNQEDFLEVETPLLTPTVDMEPTLTPFETILTSPEGKTYPLYLHPSPEIHMKKLLGKGFENIFFLGKTFRNGEWGGGRHNPEFTMLEWYRKNTDYWGIMEDCEKLILELNDQKKELPYQGNMIDLKTPWERKSIHQLFLEYSDIDLLEYKEAEKLKKIAIQKGYRANSCKTWDEVFYLIFLNEIEPHLGKEKPIFVYDYPASQRALAKVKEENPFWVERFELYIGGHELCNAFSELLDEKEQRKRLEEDRETRKKMGKTVFDIDEEFLESLKSVGAPYGGNALGADRLLMLLMDKKEIEDVILFPMTHLLNYKN